MPIIMLMHTWLMVSQNSSQVKQMQPPTLCLQALPLGQTGIIAYLRFNAHDIAAMPQLRHAKASRQVKRVQAVQIRLMVLLSAQLADGAAAKGEVHACFDGQRVVTERKAFQQCHESPGVCKAKEQVQTN
eukprot:GHRR01030764.1.p1 GENE.GHRR01030764.1~~GHRR01030764.1.p1  ORF type:complete len:130 (+),score=29.08 GHRR01030764.1:595-984(+)